ncbi:MAG: hypothetical protein ABFS02_10670 [Pseudomonadota bacterium]
MSNLSHTRLQVFAKTHHLEGLTLPSLQAINDGLPGYSVDKAQQFLTFQKRINRDLLRHRIITSNRYTAWFKRGEQNLEQIKAFIVQFSVFSNQFLVAQLNKMINADTLESMRASKEILANEIGVVFKRQSGQAAEDNVYGSTEGSVEGSMFRFKAAHFEWLLAIASKLGLTFHEVGRPKQGTPATLHFCNELIRLYGGANYKISQAASYAVENWAAAGFWGELIEGFEKFNQRTGRPLPLGFFVWHDQLESQHALHTQEELEEVYFTSGVNEDDFIRYGNEMLDGVAVFWDGLDDERRELAAVH